MPAKNKAALTTAVRRRSDSERSGHVTDEEIGEYLQEALYELWDLLIKAYGEDFWVTSSAFTLGAGQSYIELGDDATWGDSSGWYGYGYAGLWKLIRVDFERTANNITQMVPVERYSLGEVTFDNVQTAFDVLPPRYDWRFKNLYFDHLSPQNERIHVYYIPSPPVLSTSPLPAYLMGHEKYLVASAAIQVLDKEESDTSVLQRERDRLVQMIERNRPARDMFRPERIRDITASDDRSNNYFSPGYSSRRDFY